MAKFRKSLDEEYFLPQEHEPMQTFLPELDFYTSLQCLDNQRLGKQRVEAGQLLDSLIFGKGWMNHPAAKMWRGYESALALYQTLAIRAWIERGYRNTMVSVYDINTYELTKSALAEWFDFVPVGQIEYPPWLGGPIHASHRSNLLRKDPEHYAQFGWLESPDLPYFWPESDKDTSSVQENFLAFSTQELRRNSVAKRLADMNDVVMPLMMNAELVTDYWKISLIDMSKLQDLFALRDHGEKVEL